MGVDDFGVQLRENILRFHIFPVLLTTCLWNPSILFFINSYKFDTPFEREVKAEVFKIVRRGREFGTLGWYSRAFFYVGLFFGLQYLWVTTPTSYLLAIVYGMSQAFIGLNVQHDANHGASSKKHWINAIFGLGADFIGGSKWLWLEQHWTVRFNFSSSSYLQCSITPSFDFLSRKRHLS